MRPLRRDYVGKDLAMDENKEREERALAYAFKKWVENTEGADSFHVLLRTSPELGIGLEPILLGHDPEAAWMALSLFGLGSRFVWDKWGSALVNRWLSERPESPTKLCIAKWVVSLACWNANNLPEEVEKKIASVFEPQTHFWEFCGCLHIGWQKRLPLVAANIKKASHILAELGLV